MKTFYSIIFCTIRPNLDERVSIGLFMANDRECFFNYSNEKLNIIKDLISVEAYSLLKVNLKSIQKLSVSCEEGSLFPRKEASFLAENYFNYLSVYSNNLLTYSTPVHLQQDLNREVFDKLFEKFVFRLDPVPLEKTNKIDVVRKRLSKSIANYVNFDVELTEREIPGLIIPSKISFIGKNQVEVTGEMNDFSKSIHTLKQQIGSHLYLVDRIIETRRGAKFFFIGDEPSKSLVENHKIWKSIKDFKTLSLVPTNEIEQVEEYMSIHQVEPLFD